jgi:hypothetical protein
MQGVTMMLLALVAVSFVSHAGSPTPAEKLEQQRALVEAVITETELGWMVREIAPVVEEVAGRPFTRLPDLVAANPEEIAEVVYAEQVHLLARSTMADADASDAARRTAARVSGSFAGKYGFLDGRLYVSVDGIRDSLIERQADPWLLRPMVRIVIAHELAHALQDQHSDLDALVSRTASGDAIMAINCAVEGHAVWVHEQVGERMGLEEAVEILGELLGYREPMRRRMDPDDFYQVYVYGLGRDFIAWHAEHGGTEQVWDALAHPVSGTAAIVDPSRWQEPTSDVDPDLRRVLTRASKRLGAKGWRSEDGAMGDFEVRDQLVRAGGHAEIADDLDVGWNSRLVGGGAMHGVEVQLLRFKTEGGAVAFVDDMRDKAEAQARAVGPDPFIRADAGSFDRVPSDRSAHEAIRVRLFDDAEDQLGRVWVARGNDVVQVVLVNAPTNEREVAATIAQVFRAAQER